MRGFTDEERDSIEQALIDSGRRLFERHGFRKTTVRDLTESVGIAEGTFYQFFDSKAALYAEILLRENEALIDAVERELEGIEESEERLDQFISTWSDALEDRPLLLQSHQTPERLMRDLDSDSFEAGKRRIADRLFPLVEGLQPDDDRLVSQLDPAQVLDVVSLIEVLVAQREIYETHGWSDYEDFRDAFRTILKRGLLSKTE